MTGPIRIGIIDSGVREGGGLTLAAARRFSFAADGGIDAAPELDDALGHGTAVTRIVAAAAPDAALLHAQAFGTSFQTAPALVAGALDWLAAESAALVTMSFGLAADRAVLRDACARASAAGIVLVAAAPAQGRPVYPAAYDGVIAVTGDARCGQGEVSDLRGIQADFGTWCASPEQGGGPENASVVGASAAAAHFAGLAASVLARDPGAGRDGVLAHFRDRAVFTGPERRRAAVSR
jgi:subtilisin family serine protease